VPVNLRSVLSNTPLDLQSYPEPTSDANACASVETVVPSGARLEALRATLAGLSRVKGTVEL
jgi:hypothetical protein